jgi:hypothetical protein
MKNVIHSRLSRIAAASCIITSVLLTSCDNGSYNHVPPEGKGSIIVDNMTGTDAEVYLGGVYAGIAEANESAAFDLEPGVYRVVLAEKEGSRNYWRETDVLADRLTILAVTINTSNQGLYSVTVDFENP